MAMVIKAIVHDACIRGCVSKTSNVGNQYLLVRYEDENGAPCELCDKDINRQQYYKRDAIMDLYIEVVQGAKYTNIRIIDAKRHIDEIDKID